MNPYQAMVRQFHHTFGSTIGDTPLIRDRELRAKLILEEAVETAAALGFAVRAELYDPRSAFPYDDEFLIKEFEKVFTETDPVEVIDGLCDLLYVTFGTAVAAGIDLDPYFFEVHNSNMSKVGGQKRADGKVLKPKSWRPPDITGILRREVEHARSRTTAP